MRRTNTRWVAGQQSRPLAWKLLSGGLLLLACRRKAPGPDECVAFAKVWVESRHLQQLSAGTVDPFDELVRDCLTAPYDRALVECVLNGRAPDRCRLEYVRRREEHREEGAP